VGRKLDASGYTERHAFVWTTWTTDFLISSAVAEGGGLPAAAPDLPNGVTHLWIVHCSVAAECCAGNLAWVGPRRIASLTMDVSICRTTSTPAHHLRDALNVDRRYRQIHMHAGSRSSQFAQITARERPGLPPRALRAQRLPRNDRANGVTRSERPEFRLHA
jgi:hypothetical protein